MLVQTIPAGSVPRFPNKIVKSQFEQPNIIKSPKFIFDTTIDFMELTDTSMYLLESLTVSANISNAGYYESLLISPEIELIQKTTGHKLQQFPNSVTINSLGAQSLFSGYFYADSIDMLQIKVTGELSQIIETIDLESIDFVVSASIQRIMDRDFIKRIRSTWTN